jgi:hypothetical protein
VAPLANEEVSRGFLGGSAMRDMLAGWVGKSVSVALHIGELTTAVTVTLDGSWSRPAIRVCCSNSRGTNLRPDRRHPARQLARRAMRSARGTKTPPTGTAATNSSSRRAF